MDFMQHIPSEVMRIFLRDELPTPQTDVVRLHLSFCPICQEQKDELLLDDLVPHVIAVFEHPTVPNDGHIEERVLKQFWEGNIKEKSQIERISDHCLSCGVCRDKRYELWLRMRKESALTKAAAAIGFSILPALAVRSRQRRTRGPRRNVSRAVISLLVTLLLAVVLIPVSLGRKDAPLSAKVQEQGGTAHDAPLPIESPQSVAPVAAPPSNSTISKTEDKVASARHRNNLKQPDPPPARTKNVYEPPEQIDQVQNLDLSGLTADLYVRGTKKEDDMIKAPLIVPSRLGDTHLRIELPESSRKGQYIVSIQDPGRLGLSFDSPLARDVSESSDGKQISVTLNLRGLSKKEYQLNLMRENEESGDEEFLGYISVRISNAGESERRR